MNIQPMLMANSNVNERNFYDKQNEMENPVVLIMDTDTLEMIEHFKIVAEDMEDLKNMFEMKLFYTSSLPVGVVERKYGAIFFGVEPDYFSKSGEEEEEDAETKLVG